MEVRDRHENPIATCLSRPGDLRKLSFSLSHLSFSLCFLFIFFLCFVFQLVSIVP